MRPVDKGRGDDYTSKIPTSFDFSRYRDQKKKALKYCIDNNYISHVTGNTYKIAVDECLNFWLQVLTDNIESRKSTLRTQGDSKRIIVKKMIQEKVTQIYKLAGIHMIQAIGDFCCYCDSRIPGLLEVEHRCPKSQYPKFALEWDNFLISCGPCNNIKRNNPDRATTRSWMLDPPNDENDYKNKIKARFAWADIENNPYQYAVPVLFYEENENWEESPKHEALNLNNSIVSYDLANRSVKADLYDENGLIKHNVNVIVKIIRETTESKGDIIELCGLNNPGNTDSAYDRRLVNRTRAWFTALQTIKSISLMDLSSPETQPYFDLLWKSVLLTAANTGFFSVWYTILKLKKLKDPSGVDLDKRFVLESNDPNFFPGTKTDIAN